MRIFSALALTVAVSACHSQPTTAPKILVDKANLIACATGDAAFAMTCSADLARGPAGTIVTVRNPDGGFHRLLIAKDGRGVIAADGAQPARITPVEADSIEVAIGPDRYRLPATVKGR